MIMEQPNESRKFINKNNEYISYEPEVIDESNENNKPIYEKTLRSHSDTISQLLFAPNK